MKKLLISVATLATLAGPALAADIAARPVFTKAPPMAAPAAYNWSGFYSATTLGGTWWDVNGDFVAVPGDHHNTSDSRIFWGGYYGAQYQWNNWVVGVEAGYSSIFSSDYSSSVGPSADCIASTPNRTCESRITNYWQAGGRIGYAWNNVMAFASGGYANGRIQSQVFMTSTPTSFTSYTSQRHDGWYAGGGVEVFVGHWLWSDTIIGLEYQHVEFDTTRHVELLGAATNTRDMSGTMDLVQARLTFKYSLSDLGALISPVTASH